jgi:two-component system osmolarity sensor histidine kinase EnvZ
MREWLPRGLYWRTLLIIAAPAAILQLIITLVFLNDHWEATSKRMSEGVGADVGLVIQLYEADPTPANFERVRRMAWQPLRLQIALDATGAVAAPRCRSYGSAIDRYMRRALRNELQREVYYDSTCPGTQVVIRIPVPEGVLEVRAFRDRVQARSGPLFVLWIAGATAFLVIISILFIRNQVRPIEMLAEAMERFGRGEETSFFKPRGAREVRQATLAFFDMRRRIQRHIDQRAQLLAGVSHDLRTPLTRLKLQLALMAPSSDIDDAKRDLADMEATLEEYLVFAKGLWTDAMEHVDLGVIAEEAIIAVARSGVTIDYSEDGDLSARARPQAVRRALANLIDNAVAHGETVRVSARGHADWLAVAVEDDGPGIPPDLHEDAFRPFSRLDATRTKNSKGVGLGLAIARDVARAHGGDVILETSELGGLKATLRLPRGES